MNEPKNTHLVEPVVFDRAADDGWPEDAGQWPMGGSTSHPAQSSDVVVTEASGFSFMLRRNRP